MQKLQDSQHRAMYHWGRTQSIY